MNLCCIRNLSETLFNKRMITVSQWHFNLFKMTALQLVQPHLSRVPKPVVTFVSCQRQQHAISSQQFYCTDLSRRPFLPEIKHAADCICSNSLFIYLFSIEYWQVIALGLLCQFWWGADRAFVTLFFVLLAHRLWRLAEWQYLL